MRQFRFMVLGALAVLGLVLFQNCNPTAKDQVEDEALSSLSQKMSFPYDARPDQLAYTSCSGGGDVSNGPSDGNPFFTFRVGAYHNYGGLRLTSAFLNDAGGVSKDEMESTLDVAPMSAKARLQLAVRPAGNLQNIWKLGGGQEGRDYAHMLAPLDLPALTSILVDLAAQAKRLKYARFSYNPQGLRMDSKLYFMSDVAGEHNLRSAFNGSSSGGRLMVTTTYTDPEQSIAYSARAPADYGHTGPDVNRAVYGKGLQISFQQPASYGGIAPHVQFPNSVMSQVSEVDLQQASSTPVAWVCRQDLQFKIFRRSDVTVWNDGVWQNGVQTAPPFKGNQPPCYEKPDPPQLSETLRIVRHSFPAEDWFVDLENRCLIPKRDTKFSCYPPVPPSVVEKSTEYYQPYYHLSNQCMDGASGSGARCLRMASICYRAN